MAPKNNTNFVYSVITHHIFVIHIQLMTTIHLFRGPNLLSKFSHTHTHNYSFNPTCDDRISEQENNVLQISLKFLLTTT